MRPTAKGRVQRSATEWQAIMRRYERSGLQQGAFCTREGLALHTFKKHYRHDKEAASQPGHFVEVSPFPARRPGWEVGVEVPHGIRLQMRGTGHVE
ncbi:MAG: hypothetical protein AB1671_28605 [Thermodesulfobacteriota bacterium]|jgi:hypothetical protein